jgi:iron complex outermembrane receptor protein
VATNFDKLRFTGAEASLVYEPAPGQRIQVSFAGLHGVNASAELLESKYLFNYPVESAVVEWRGAVGRHVLARTRVGAMNRVARNPYALWEASAAWSTGHVRPYLQLTNITSTVYEEIPNVAMPKRGVIGGLEFVFFGAGK